MLFFRISVIVLTILQIVLFITSQMAKGDNQFIYVHLAILVVLIAFTGMLANRLKRNIAGYVIGTILLPYIVPLVLAFLKVKAKEPPQPEKLPTAARSPAAPPSPAATKSSATTPSPAVSMPPPATPVEENIWKCPSCGVVLQMSEMASVFRDNLHGGGVLMGTVTCGSCSKAFPAADVYSGKYAVGKSPSLSHLLVFRQGPKPDDTGWYISELVKGLFLKVDGQTKIQFMTTETLDDTFCLMAAMTAGVSSAQLEKARLQNFHDKDGYSGRVVKVE